MCHSRSLSRYGLEITAATPAALARRQSSGRGKPSTANSGAPPAASRMRDALPIGRPLDHGVPHDCNRVALAPRFLLAHVPRVIAAELAGVGQRGGRLGTSGTNHDQPVVRFDRRVGRRQRAFVQRRRRRQSPRRIPAVTRRGQRLGRAAPIDASRC